MELKTDSQLSVTVKILEMDQLARKKGLFGRPRLPWACWWHTPGPVVKYSIMEGKVRWDELLT